MKKLMFMVVVLMTAASAWAIPDYKMVLHLQADAGIVEDEGKIVAWEDQSGAGNDALNLKLDTTMTADELPVLETNVLNGNPIVRFDGVDDALVIWANPEDETRDKDADSLGIAGSTGATVFLVAYLDSGVTPDSGQRMFGHTGSDNFGIQFQTGGRASFAASGKTLWGDASGTYSGNEGGIILAGRFDAGKIELWQEGQYYRSTTGATIPLFSESPVAVGAYEYIGALQNFFNGGVAEIIVYNRALDDDELNVVGYYLEQKYGLDTVYIPPDSNVTLVIQTNPVTGESCVTPSAGAYIYPRNTLVDIYALERFVNCPDVGIFYYWDGDVDNATSANTTVLMNTNKTITAVFADDRRCGDECHPDPLGDGDNDCNVNFVTFAIVANDWLKSGIIPCPNLPGDLNGNCNVGVEDLQMVADYWLECTSPYCLGGSQMKHKAPFKVLYNNDCTNFYTQESPWYNDSDGWRKPTVSEVMYEEVKETANIGVDVHLLSPGLGWVPWWQSDILPPEVHYSWYEQTYGVNNWNPQDQYIIDGGDIVADFIQYCREFNLSPFISYRLNDHHALGHVNDSPESASGYWAFGISQFYYDNPQYRIDPDILQSHYLVHNWAIQAVRDHKYDFMEELCENYDLDGLELDFLRFFEYFNDDTSIAQRAQIMTGFVARVRALLDRTAEPGQHRWLCVRVPDHLEEHDDLGIDIRAFVDAGVDMINVSPSYVTQQQNDLHEIKAMVPDAMVYLEMEYNTMLGETVSGLNYDIRRLTTDEQFYTTSHQAYSHGADGMSLFNFHYFRWSVNSLVRNYYETMLGTPLPDLEPPFHMIQYLGDPEWLAQQPQHYFVGRVSMEPYPPEEFRLAKTINLGQTLTFNMDFSEPNDGWTQDGKLRIQSNGTDLVGRTWTIKINNTTLVSTGDTSEPYPNPYPDVIGLGDPNTLRAWIVPASLLIDGNNKVEITLDSGSSAILWFIDLAIE